MTAIKKDIKLSNIDSVRNCRISCDRFDPSVFRTPTSLALLVDLAVAKFIKFIQAINSMNSATIENILT